MLVIHVRRKVFVYYDVIKTLGVEELIDNATEFLHRENKYHRNSRFPKYYWQDFQFERIVGEDIDVLDSGVFILKWAKNICSGENCEVNLLTLSAFRGEILDTLYSNRRCT